MHKLKVPMIDKSGGYTGSCFISPDQAIPKSKIATA